MMPKILARDEKGKYGVEWEGQTLKLTSVTKVTDCAMKHALLFFYGKHGTKKAREIAAEAAQIGTDTHVYCEAWFLKEKIVNTSGDIKKIRNCIANFKAFVKKFEPVPYTIDGEMCLEMTVFSISHLYAGTFDGLFRLNDGRLVLIDWKTSSGIWDDYYIQIEAYYRALTELAKRGIINLKDKVDALMIVRFDKDERFDVDEDVVTLEPGNESRFNAFLGLNSYSKWKESAKELK